MFEVIAIVAVVLAIVIAVILILAATKPDTFSVARAIDVKSSPDRTISADQRFSSMDVVVALRKQGPRDEAQL